MNAATDRPGTAQTRKPYAAGEITRRLQRLAQDKATAQRSVDDLEPYRRAASVLVAINPATLNAVGEVSESTKGGLALLPELIPSPYSQFREAFPLTLAVATRKRALQSLGTQTALQSAIDANPIHPDTLLQRTLVDAIKGNTFDLSAATTEELTALATVCDWLEGTDIGKQLPSIESIRQRIEQRRDQDSLRHLASDMFTGREKEVFQVRRHLASNERRILFVSAPGGTGKSALLSEVLLSWMRDNELTPGTSSQNAWVRIDLDHSMVEPDRPVTILREAARQLSRRYPDLASVLYDFVRDTGKTEARVDDAQLEASSAMDWSQRGLTRLTDEFVNILRLTGTASTQRLVFWIDTFEEAQFLGKGVVANSLEFIGELASAPGIRVIVSGREPLGTSEMMDPPLERLPLRDLPRSAARELLAKLMSRTAAGFAMAQSGLLDKAVQTLGGNPLTLHLAAPLIAAEGELTLAKLASLRKEVLQRRLYSRILEHIHTPEIQKLAGLGLVVRRLTPGVIQEVLAGPCGMGQIDDAHALHLLEEFAREITLVDEDQEDRSLRHRQDIRQLMLKAMPREMAPVIRQIDQNAVRYWQGRHDTMARAEEIYHRLRLNDSRAVLSKRWHPDAGPLLRGALDEFPRGSPQRVWLAGKLRAVVDESELAASGQAEWEQQAALEAQRYLLESEPEQALRVLGRRSARLPGSRLYGIQSRAHLFLGNSNAAIACAQAGIRASHAQFKEVAVDLALLVAFINERNARFDDAFVALNVASKLAAETGDPLLQLSCGLRRLRMQRMSAHLGEGHNERPELIALAHSIGPHALAKRPAVLRELAAELGQDDPEFLRWGGDLLMEELLQPLTNEELIEVLRDLQAVSPEEADWMKTADPTELLKLSRHRIEERLSSQSSARSEISARIQRLFQQSIEANLHKEFVPAPKRAVSKSNDKPEQFPLDPEIRAELAAIIAEFPVDTLHRIARFRLRADYARLSQGRDALATATEIVDRSIKLGRVPGLIADLEQAAPSPSLREQLGAQKMILML